MHRYLQNNICYFRSPISPWRVYQRKSLFWAFILRMVHIFTIWKISLLRHPLQAFLNIFLNFGQTFLQTMWWNFFGAKYGSEPSQKVQFFWLGGFIEWETSVYFCPLLEFFKTPLTLLTYSALIAFREWLQETCDLWNTWSEWWGDMTGPKTVKKKNAKSNPRDLWQS